MKLARTIVYIDGVKFDDTGELVFVGKGGINAMKYIGSASEVMGLKGALGITVVYIDGEQFRANGALVFVGKEGKNAIKHVCSSASEARRISLGSQDRHVLVGQGSYFVDGEAHKVDLFFHAAETWVTGLSAVGSLKATIGGCILRKKLNKVSNVVVGTEYKFQKVSSD